MDGNVIISGSQVNNNKTIGMYSGGIVVLLGSATVTDGSQVDGNSNNGPGGGIAANFGGPVVVTNGSQVNGNAAGSRRWDRQFVDELRHQHHRRQRGR